MLHGMWDGMFSSLNRPIMAILSDRNLANRGMLSAHKWSRKFPICLVSTHLEVLHNIRGTGHIYRALELADEFYGKPDIYYDINQTDRAIFGKTTHHLIPITGIAELFEICRQNQYGIFINELI